MIITMTFSDSAGGTRQMKLTFGEREVLRVSGIFSERPDRPCPDCGGFHLRACPRVKSQEWLGNGNRVKVEYWPDGSWDESAVIYPEDVYDDSPEEEEKNA
jgi:hypothetical protein